MMAMKYNLMDVLIVNFNVKKAVQYVILINVYYATKDGL